MRDHKRRTVRAALPLLLGAAAAIFSASAAAASLRQKSYTDAQNNYSFSYPAAYRLRAETDFFELSQARKPVLYGRVSEIYLVDESGEQVEYRNTKEEFVKYARQQAKNNCAADGPDESLYCTGVNKEAVFDVGGGLTAVELYLNHVYERNGRKTQTIYGPVYVLNLSTAERARSLLVEPATAGTIRRTAAPPLQQLMRGLVESVQITSR